MMRKSIALVMALMLLTACMGTTALAGTASGFNIGLDANLTTGYDWKVAFSDETLAHLEGSYVLMDGAENLSGAGGFYDYILLGDKEGEGTVALTYMQGDQEDTVEVTVTYTFYIDDELNVHVTETGVSF